MFKTMYLEQINKYLLFYSENNLIGRYERYSNKLIEIIGVNLDEIILKLKGDKIKSNYLFNDYDDAIKCTKVLNYLL